MAGWGTKLIGFRGAISGITGLGKKWTPSKKWVVGTAVEYSVYLEFGTKNHPPYPFLFPALPHVMSRYGDQLAAAASSADDLIRLIALATERQAKLNASARGAANTFGGSQASLPGRERSPGTHPDHPQVDTSTLVSSIRAEEL